MLSKIKSFPSFVRISIILVGLYTLVSILYIAQDFFVPLIFSFLIAILISPMVDFLVRHKVKRMLAVILVFLFFTLIFAGLILLLVSQANLLNKALPELTEKFQVLYDEIMRWIYSRFNFTEAKINSWLAAEQGKFVSQISASAMGILSTVGGVLSVFFLIPVYVFMILYYQPHLGAFLRQLFGSNKNEKVSEIIFESKVIIQQYITGLFIESIILAVMNSLALLALGVDYFILLGVIGAILNVIPYLGGLISLILYAGIVFMTKSPIYVFYVVALFTIIQSIDNNLIVPRVVGSKVKLNALFSFISVILGGALWGISGMFLSLIIVAILKLIFDRVDSLKPLGFLLGTVQTKKVKVKKSN